MMHAQKAIEFTDECESNREGERVREERESVVGTANRNWIGNLSLVDGKFLYKSNANNMKK